MTGPTRIDIHELLEQREWLQRLACRLLGVGPDADDLTQETLARALAAPAPRAFSRAWLARIARNLFAERRRSEAGRRSHEEVAARPEATGDSDAVDRADLQRVLLEAVLRLEEPSRTAVILRYLEGQSYEDIALRQKASVPAIRKRVSRAIELLKIELDEHSGGRREWGVVLLPILGVKLPEVSPAIPAATLPSVLTGVLAMSTKSKLAASLAALVLIGAFVVPALITPRSRTSEVQPGTVAQVLPTATVLDGGASQNDRVTVTNERTDEVEPRKTSVLAFPVQPRSTVGTLELRLEWPDGSPADGVVARIVPWGTDAFLYRREVRSGPQGIALVEQLAPGLVGVYLDRGPGGNVEVEAGRTSVFEVQIEPGFTAKGRVLDADGNVVLNAQICLSDYGNLREGHVVGSSGPTGEYEIRDLSGSRHVSARHQGMAASAQYSLSGYPGDVVELDLQLRGTGGTISGVVYSPDGDPLEGARVLICPEAPASWLPQNDQHPHQRTPLPIELRTDPDGKFVTAEVGVGAMTVQARAGFGHPWSSHETVEPGATLEMEIHLTHGAALQGIVRDADGAPVSGARVAVGLYGQFDTRAAVSDESGAYRLFGLPSGEVTVVASLREYGKAEGKPVLIQGADNRWDATLTEGNRVAGTVVDMRGSPLIGWNVRAGKSLGLWSANVKTDEEGRFKLTGIPPSVDMLTIAPPGIWSLDAMILRGALPAVHDLMIKVPDDVRPTASMVVRVLRAGMPPGDGTKVQLRSMQPYSQQLRLDDEGRVRVPDLIPGEYTLEVRVPGCAELHRTFTATPDDEVDLGTLEVATGGRVHCFVSHSTGAAMERVYATIIDTEGIESRSIQINDGEGVSSPVSPGEVIVRIQGQGLAAQFVNAFVADGETTEVRATLRDGTSRWIAIRDTSGVSIIGFSRMSVLDPMGRPILTGGRLLGGALSGTPTRIYLDGLEMGAYSLEFVAMDGRTGSGELIVSSLQALEGDALVIDVQ